MNRSLDPTPAPSKLSSRPTLQAYSNVPPVPSRPSLAAIPGDGQTSQKAFEVIKCKCSRASLHEPTPHMFSVALIDSQW